MFVEYPFSIDAHKAEIKLNTIVHNVNSDKSMIYIEREQDDFTAVIKMRMKRRTYDEQRWSIDRTSKGLKLKRIWSTGYLIDIFITVIIGLAGLASIIFSFINTDIRIEMILLGLVFCLMLMFYIWKRIATPMITLKILMIKIL